MSMDTVVWRVFRTSSTHDTLHVLDLVPHMGPMCGLLPHTPVLCVPFHHRCWHEIRTVWFACGGNVDRIQDKIGLHLNVIRTNSAKKQVAFAWNSGGLGCIWMEY